MRFARLTVVGLLLGLGLAAWGAAPPSANAQAWTMGSGETYVKLSYGSVTATQRYTFDGAVADYSSFSESQIPGVPFRDQSLYLYTETGLSDRFTLVLNVPYKRITVLEPSLRYRTRAFGDVQVAGRYDVAGLFGGLGANALAVNLSASLPMGYTRNYNPSAGTGQANASVTLDYGRSFYPLPLYAQVGAGYRYRSGWYGLSQAKQGCNSAIDCTEDNTAALGDEWVFSAEVGSTPLGGAVLVQALARGVWSVETPDASFSILNPLPTRQRYVKVGGGLTLYPMQWIAGETLDPLGLSVQYFVTPIGANTIRSQDLFVGVEYRLKPLTLLGS